MACFHRNPEPLSFPTPVILAAAGIQSPDHTPGLLCHLRRAGWSSRCSAWGVPADPHQVGWEKGLWIPTSVRMTGGSPGSHMRMKMACFHSNPESLLSPTPVILAAAGIQSPDHAPGLLCQLRRAGWSGRCSAWGVPADPHQVGWEKGLWIPTAVRMTGGSPRSHMGMKMACFHSNPEALLSPTPVILAAAGIQSPDHAPGLLCQLRRAG